MSEVRNSDDCFSWGFGSNEIAVTDESGAVLSSATFQDWGVQRALDPDVSSALRAVFNPNGVLVCVWEVQLEFETSAQTLQLAIDRTPEGWEHPIWGFPGASCDSLEPSACYAGYAESWSVEGFEERGWMVEICDAPAGASTLDLCEGDMKLGAIPAPAPTSPEAAQERIVDASCGEEQCAGIWKTVDGALMFEAWGMGDYFGVITVCVEKVTEVCQEMSPQEMPTGDFEWRLPWIDNFPQEGSGTYRVTMTSEYGSPVGAGSWQFDWNSSS